jgi:predicted transcriptional regulator
MTRTNQLGELQLAILQELWRCGEATVSDVHAALYPARQLAPTTIATMLKKMEARGLVRHRTEGRRFIYQPAVSEDVVTRSMVADLTERLFEGKASDLVSYLIREHIDSDELSELNELIAKAEEADEERS